MWYMKVKSMIYASDIFYLVINFLNLKKSKFKPHFRLLFYVH